MEYLDPKHEFRHRVMLMIGYICIAVAVTLAALVLLYKAYGFDIGKNGTVIQHGLTFFSSQPSPANIYVDGKLMKVKTNTRLPLPEGIYDIKITRNGYLPWERKIQLEGGKVQHYDYPFLIPNTLAPKRVATYSAPPPLVTQSPDRRWLVVNKPSEFLSFDLYDLKGKELKPAETITLPQTLVPESTSASSWQLVEWADNNKHLLLKHVIAPDRYEYVLLDRAAPEASINVTVTHGITAPQLTLKNRKFDQYYLFDPASGNLASQKFDEPVTNVLSRVLAFKPYGNNSILYATDNGAPAGKVLVRLLAGSTTYTIRNFAAGSTYLVDLATYSGDLYVAAGAASANRVYIYKDPVGQSRELPKQALVPQQVLHIENPNFLGFSSSAQFIAAQSGQNFSLYDFENENGYKYVANEPIDPPQTNAVWMDGHRLTYVSGGMLLVFDYDHINRHSLVPAAPNYRPAFSSDYETLYTLAPNASNQFELLQTSLLAPADQ